MLFLAVTLGFVAENYRENQVIAANLQQNYSAMLKELAKDREQIDRIYRPRPHANERARAPVCRLRTS